MRAIRPLICGFAVVGLSTPALATNPSWPNAEATRAELALPANWPDDPSFGYLTPATCTPGGPMVYRPQDGNWELWGFYPPDTTDPCNSGATPFTLAETLLAPERASLQGTGMSADMAWTMTTGDPRVLIAVHDSGAEWENSDLVNKWFLNKGELPLPKHADGTDCTDYDCNGDGVFNVLDFTSGSGHDQPTIGSITDPRISGYVCADNPTCKGDTNGNGVLDPEDLIRIFSNGIDEDGNGFVDDISGWDFLWNDNDAYDDTRYGHGTGEASWSAAEGNNGIGSIGTCPDCRVMMVRVGDSFIADSDHFAEGVFFSLSHGANVIQEALGALNNTALMQTAIDAAYAQGAIVIASAADEDSIHHNYPGNAEHTVIVHAVEHDANDEDATSFVRFNNCSNGGGHLALSTPAGSCSSEATGLSAGEAGLLYSAMLKFNPSAPPLTGNEAMQLMWMSAENINIPGSATNPLLYPSQPGWAQYFGYGRNDAGAAVAAVKAGQIPPEVDVTSPKWFQTIDPTQTPTLTITGTVAANRAPSYDFTVSVAAGVEPLAADFQPAGSKTGLKVATTGTLATFDLANLIANPAAVSSDPNAFAATILVQAVAHYGGTIGDVQGQFRKSFFVHRDPDLFAGFPVWVGASGDSSPHMVDVDGSGHDRLFMATADGLIHSFLATGKESPGWPVSVDPLTDVAAHPNFPAFGSAGAAAGTHQAILATVAVGSLNGDGKFQVVASTLDGQTYAWNTDGTLLPGFPVSADPAHFHSGFDNKTDADGTVETYVLGKAFFASPVLVDLGGDGKLEIVQPGEDGWLYVWDSTGTPYPGFPVEVHVPTHVLVGSTYQIQHARLMASPAVGDINGDGFPEIIIGSNEVYGSGTTREYAVWHDGNNHSGGPFLPGWPIAPPSFDNDTLPDIGLGEPNSAALADLDGDGKDEIGIAPMSSYVQFYNGAGKQLGQGEVQITGAKANELDAPYMVAISSGAFGDIDGDGKLDFANGTLGLKFAVGGISGYDRVTPSHAVSAWGVGLAEKGAVPGWTAEPLPGFPAAVPDFQFFMNFAIADIGGEGKNSILSGSGVYLATAFYADGTQPAGWPKNTGGWLITTPTVGDLDGDGYLDVVTTTREGWVWAWHTKALASEKIEWEGFHHDARNTGNYGTPLETRHGPTTSGKGCLAGKKSCDSSGVESSLGLLVAGFLGKRRRARSRE